MLVAEAAPGVVVALVVLDVQDAVDVQQGVEDAVVAVDAEINS